jgi:hypothetical protein
MKLKTTSLIASVSMAIFGMGVLGFFGIHNKLLNLRFAHQHKKLESDSQFPIPISKGTILLLLAVGVINPLSAHHKNKTSRSTSQTKSTQKSNDFKMNPSRIPDSMRYLGLNESHMETFAELRNAVCGDANFIILTGDSGTGKTKLIQCLKTEISPEYVILEIDNEFQNTKDLFMSIAAQTGINQNFSSKGAFLIRFDKYLQTVQAENKKILFIVDLFTAKAKLIKELAFLTNIKIEHQRIIKILISSENISFSPDDSYKLKNSSVVTCHLKRLNTGETTNHISCMPERDDTKNSILQQGTVQNNIWKSPGIFREIIKIYDGAQNFLNEKKLRATIPGSIEKCRQKFNLFMSGRENIYRKILVKTQQAKALFDNISGRFTTWKLFERSKNFAGIIKQCAVDAFTKVLARIRSFVQSASKNLYIKQRTHWHTHFSISGLFDSFLWNSVLAVSLFAVALAFSFWYQGILPFKPDAPESKDFQTKYDSPKMDQKNFYEKEAITSSEQLLPKSERQLSTEQDLSDVSRQNELKPKLQIIRPEPLEANYFVQVGAFRNKQNAMKTVSNLKLKGYTAKIVTFTDSKNRLWHTVRLGEYASLKVAKKHAVEFSNQEKMDSIVLPLKKQ